MTNTNISITPIFGELALRKIAQFGSSYLGNDIYYMKEFIDLMINIVGEDKLIELLKNDDSDNKKRNNEIGKNWNEPFGTKRKLIEFDIIVEKTKASYDILEDKTLNKIKDLKYEDFINKAKKIPAIKPDLYSLFVFLINCSSIQRMTIKPEWYKILEHRGNRSIGELEKKRVGHQPDKS